MAGLGGSEFSYLASPLPTTISVSFTAPLGLFRARGPASSSWTAPRFAAAAVVAGVDRVVPLPLPADAPRVDGGMGTG